jgi:pilus assembly protein Flp/PilA
MLPHHGWMLDSKSKEGRAREAMTQTFWKEVWSDSRGQDLVEYALAAGLVAVAAVAAMPTLSATVSTVFSKVGSIISANVN